MRRCGLVLMVVIGLCGGAVAQGAPKFRALAFYSEKVERDHVDFAHAALKFYADAAKRDGFELVTTMNWDDLNAENLKQYQLVVWLDDFPATQAQRTAFEQYMKGGGGWLGFHIAAYNDEGTKWPWFVSFLGGGVFEGNNWPPLPATLVVEARNHAVTKGLPESFVAPANEWYSWKPSPRANTEVKVLLSLAASNYPLGFKDTLRGGDVPVVWTNTRYRMLYLNMGHGDRIFTDAVQNKLLEQAMVWVGTKR